MGNAGNFVGYQVDTATGFEQDEWGLVIKAIGGLVEPATKSRHSTEHFFAFADQGQQFQYLFAGGGAEALLALAIGTQGFGGGME